ncbi:MAG: tRNA preQ1(34) S-adenosylmethionine ribosyltransferase-isomerase QueA [Brevinematales bacterium]|nr:tRNA preQ1(34) S-adenosylmethionine ribosyltransferase-isomerase QueA [Brevinematales bacterium]
MDIKEFDFYLPEDLIAHEPISQRDKCRLLVVDRKTSTFHERVFSDIVEYLNKGDVLVLNNSRVIKAKVFAKSRKTGKLYEMLITNFIGNNEFIALVKNLKRLKIDEQLEVQDFIFTFKGIKDGLGVFVANRNFSINDLEEIGQIPLPPYIEKKRQKLKLPVATKEDELFYQTVYSSIYGSIASPTAGLHFTEELLSKIEQKGVLIRYITLHVGLGTFEPIRTEKVEEFRLRGEYMEASKEVIQDIIKAKERGNRVFAVGTTVVRTLETVFRDIKENMEGYKGITNIFIYPGFEFRAVDALVTNFHLPKSSLILLVSAFAGKDLILKSYNYAVQNKFRFYSYGDAMLIL